MYNDAIELKLDIWEQHETFSQDTKAGFLHVYCFEEVAVFDLSRSFHESNLVP